MYILLENIKLKIVQIKEFPYFEVSSSNNMYPYISELVIFLYSIPGGPFGVSASSEFGRCSSFLGS